MGSGRFGVDGLIVMPLVGRANDLVKEAVIHQNLKMEGAIALEVTLKWKNVKEDQNYAHRLTAIGLHGQGGPHVAQIVVEAISHEQEHVTTHHQKTVAIIVVSMEVYQQSKDHAIEKDVTLINRGKMIQKPIYFPEECGFKIS